MKIQKNTAVNYRKNLTIFEFIKFTWFSGLWPWSFQCSGSLIFSGKGSVSPLLQSYENEQQYLAIRGNHWEKDSFTCGQKDISNLNDAKIIKLEKLALPSTGAGRLLMLEQSLTLSKALDLMKNHLGLSHLRLAIANSASMGKILIQLIYLIRVSLFCLRGRP